MRKLTSFTFVSLDGYYKGLNEDISWHIHGKEEEKFSAENLQSGNMLLFGRITYLMMSAFWTSSIAFEHYPLVAEKMNKAEKIVFSETLTSADWVNSRIISGNCIDEIRLLKQTKGKDMTILGSGSIVNLFMVENLIDEFQLMIDPVLLGKGTSLFKSLHQKMNLQLLNTQIFNSGSVLHRYKPLRDS